MGGFAFTLTFELIHARSSITSDINPAHFQNPIVSEGQDLFNMTLNYPQSEREKRKEVAD